MPVKDTFFITTAIPYMNAPAHIGHAYEQVLADILARYHRTKGETVVFLTGSDEHGSKIVRAAQKADKSTQSFVDEYVKQYQELWRDYLISYDEFIRTSDKERHWPGAQALWSKLIEAGDIYKGTYHGLYCVGCEAFVTEKELVEGKCPHHNTVPEKIDEENYFFRLSKYTPRVREAIESGAFTIIPEGRKNEILELLSGEVEDISFSRPEGAIPWGVPVPGDPSQMMYVWCDALSNYITAAGYGTDEARFARLWPADIQVVGKDIVRFHAVIWPAMLLSAGIPLPKSLLVHGFITSGGRKMSKTIGNVVDPKEYVERYGAEALRFFLAREISSVEDGDFTEEKLIASYNGNLANGIGNLVSRTIKMATQYFDGAVSRTSETDVPINQTVETMSGVETREGWTIPYIIKNDILPAYTDAMDRCEVHKAMEAVLRLTALLDAYIAGHEPYKLIKTDRVKTESIITNALYGIFFAAVMLEPVIPESAKKIFATLGADEDMKHFNITPLEQSLFPRKEAIKQAEQ